MQTTKREGRLARRSVMSVNYFQSFSEDARCHRAWHLRETVPTTTALGWGCLSVRQTDRPTAIKMGSHSSEFHSEHRYYVHIFVPVLPVWTAAGPCDVPICLSEQQQGLVMCQFVFLNRSRALWCANLSFWTAAEPCGVPICLSEQQQGPVMCQFVFLNSSRALWRANLSFWTAEGPCDVLIPCQKKSYWTLSAFTILGPKARFQRAQVRDGQTFDRGRLSVSIAIYVPPQYDQQLFVWQHFESTNLVAEAFCQPTVTNKDTEADWPTNIQNTAIRFA